VIRHLRVIEGGKDKRKIAATGIKLYRAYSVSNLLTEDAVYHNVKITWYCLERKVPPAPFDVLIDDYYSLPDKLRKILEIDVKRYLTGTELEALRRYMESRYDIEVFADEVKLPVSTKGFFSNDDRVVVYDFLELSEKDGYNLPFKIWGYYTTANAITTPSLERGVRFLSKALEYLGLENECTREELERVVGYIFERELLYVKKKD